MKIQKIAHLFAVVMVLNAVLVITLTIVTANLLSQDSLQNEAENRMVAEASNVANKLEISNTRTETAVNSLCMALESTLDVNRAIADTGYRAAWSEEAAGVLELMGEETQGIFAAYFFLDPNVFGDEVRVVYKRTSIEDPTYIRNPYPASISDFSPDDPSIAWFWEPIRSRETIWTDPYYWELWNMELITCSAPIIIDGQAVGMVGMDVSYEEYRETIAGLQIYSSGGASLLDKELHFVVDRDIEPGTSLYSAYDGSLAVLADSIAASPAGIDYSVLNGVETIFSFARLQNGEVVLLYAPLEEAMAESSRLRLGLLLATLGVVAMSVIAAFILGRWIAQPIEMASAHAEAVASGDLSATIPAAVSSRADEIGILGQALQKMGRSLQQMIDELQNQSQVISEQNQQLKSHSESLEELVHIRTLELEEKNARLMEEMQVRERTEAELVEARDAAEHANKAKSQFLANMSHEIRTPLNAIIGFSELLPGVADSPEARRYAEAITTSGQSLLTLLTDILDLSRIEAHAVSLELKPTSLRRLYAEIEQMIKFKAEGKGLALTTCIEADVPEWLLLDESRLRQVLVNLAGNAVKFTDEGWVAIKAAMDTEVAADQGRELANLVLTVTDTGIGIAPEAYDWIFQDFSQQVESGYKYSEGVGLGLAISKRLVELMGGTISVESVPGQGSLFKVILKDVAIADAAGPATVESEYPWRQIRFVPACILAADDIESNRQLIKDVLQGKGLEVLLAANGVECIELAQRHHPRLIIMDIQMPVLDGLEASRRLQSDPGTAGIPMVIMSASPRTMDDYKKMGIKAAGCLSKPLSMASLVKCLADYIDTLPAGDSGQSRTGSGYQESDNGSEKYALAGLVNPDINPILIVDDNELNLTMARAHLERLGFRVDVCQSGQDALVKFRQGYYSLIFMDCMMPRMDGWETAAQIRSLEKMDEYGGGHIPIIAMTALSGAENQARSLLAGMDGFIVKPFTMASLLTILRQWLPEAFAS